MQNQQFSPSEQENFVIAMTQLKKGGHYVELGAFNSHEGSNTRILEEDFNWNGVSFEIDPERKEQFTSNRKNPCFGDALSFDYTEYFKSQEWPKQIDFLQVDIDNGYDQAMRPEGSPYTSLLGLISLPLTVYRFSVITFEHDANMYFRNQSIRDAQREILDALGYTLVVRTIHEDWWVDPTVIQPDIYRQQLRWEVL
jgi:hypothetical protein